MDFGIRIFREIQITENITFYLTETLAVTWIIVVALSIFAVIVGIKARKWEAMAKPSGLQNVIEFAVETFEGFFRSSSSVKVVNLAPWFFTLFVFLVFANTIGVTGMRPPTADWGMTFPLAVSSLILFQYAGLKHRPKNYLKGFFRPVFVFFPINLIGEFAKPIALSFRLFGNVLGGVILLSLVYGISPLVLQLGFPAFLHAYFDIAAGILQAFIFMMLSITFVGLAAED